MGQIGEERRDRRAGVREDKNEDVTDYRGKNKRNMRKEGVQVMIQAVPFTTAYLLLHYAIMSIIKIEHIDPQELEGGQTLEEI